MCVHVCAMRMCNVWGKRCGRHIIERSGLGHECGLIKTAVRTSRAVLGLIYR